MKHFEIVRIIIGLVLLVQTVANPLDLVDEEGLIFFADGSGSGSGSGSGAGESELIFDANSGDGSGSGTDDLEIFSSDASGDGSGSGAAEFVVDPTTTTTEATAPTSTTTTTTTTFNPIVEEGFLGNWLPTIINGENIDLIDGSSTQTTTTTVEPTTTTTTTSVEPTTTTTTVEPTTSTSTSEITNEDANEGVQIIEEEEEIVISPGNYPARKVSKTVHQGPIKTRTRRHLDGDASDEDSFGFGDEMELFESDFGVQPGTEEQEEDILPRLTRSTNKAKSLLLVFLQNLF